MPILACAMRRANAEALYRPFRNTRRDSQCAARTCDHPACSAEGLYRAPVDRDRLDEYYWFCLEHVREYNRSWNFFEGLSADQIEAIRRWDTTWNRPSWPFASVGRATGPNAFRDDFGFFHEEQTQERQQRQQWENHRRERENGHAHGRRRKANLNGDTDEEQALAELELEPPVSFDAIKRRYKELVKTLHPDVNGGDASNEDRLKTVNQAYATLRAAYARY